MVEYRVFVLTGDIRFIKIRTLGEKMVIEDGIRKGMLVLLCFRVLWSNNASLSREQHMSV